MEEPEIMQWLNDKERSRWRMWSRDHALVCDPDAVAALRSLAETRKALAQLEYVYEGVDVCHFCNTQEGAGPHKPDCIFATMPRPVKP